MPERVTKEERMVTLAIEKARKTIETMRESTQVIPVDTEVEVQKIKRPKVQDASKITNQTQEKEGYGLAGESLKKSMNFESNAKEFYQRTLSNMQNLPDKSVQNNFEYELSKIAKQKGAPLTYADVNNAKIMVSKSGYIRKSFKKSLVLKFDDEMALNGENVREANSLAPRFVGPHFSINLKRDEITEVLKEFNKKYPNVRLYKVTNGDKYISAFVNLAAYLYPKNVGRTFSNIGESQFKKK